MKQAVVFMKAASWLSLLVGIWSRVVCDAAERRMRVPVRCRSRAGKVLMRVLIVLYKSAFDIQRVTQLFRERMDKYGAVPGLLQKLYVHDPETDEVGGIYVFESRESLEEFRRSDLEKSIRETYQFTAPPVIRTLEVVQALREQPPALDR